MGSAQKAASKQSSAQLTAPAGMAGLQSLPPAFDLIELFFFAYRDFVGDADRLLQTWNYGRAHHRVLHFVNRHPGLSVAALLDILKITKQSLNRVMKELIAKGHIDVREGPADRRQRLLYPTNPGCQLALQLAGLQTQRFSSALALLGHNGDTPPDQQALDFLLAMVDEGERHKVASLIWPEGRRPVLARVAASSGKDIAA